MSTLRNQIAAYDEQKAQQLSSDILKTMDQTTQILKASDLEKQGLKTGGLAPEFILPNHKGVSQSLSNYLSDSPLVLSFYRGGWCPYCNMELNALQKVLSEIEQAGAKLVAISPEVPDHSLATMEKNELTFDVLYDEGNRVAKTFGLVFELPEVLRPLYDELGIDIIGHNGDNSFQLPMPATYIISQQGEILYHFIDADYTKRSEPAEIIEKLREM